MVILVKTRYSFNKTAFQAGVDILDYVNNVRAQILNNFNDKLRPP